MIDYDYSYIVGALIFTAVWAMLYLYSRQHRVQIIWGSLIAAPFALTGFLFIPEYWSPPSLFDWAQRFGVSIEDVLWSAAVGGIASAVSEIVFHERLERARAGEAPRRYAPLALVVVVFVGLEFLWPRSSIYNMMLAFAAGATLTAVLRRDLIGRMLRGAAVFTVVYLLLFVYFLGLFDEFISRFYNEDGLLGVYVLGVPIEELLFAFTGGAIWSVMYEYVHSYRLVSLAPVRFVQEGR